jgi:hypothetical protein
VTAVITPFLPFLPEAWKVRALAVAGAAGGAAALLAALNQSIKTGHVSMPQDFAQQVVSVFSQLQLAVPDAVAKQVKPETPASPAAVSQDERKIQ